MQAWQQILLGLIGGGICIGVGFQIGMMYVSSQAVAQIDEAEERIRALMYPEVVEAQKFRQRTAESDPSRHTRVRTIRLRAKRTITPPPRK